MHTRTAMILTLAMSIWVHAAIVTVDDDGPADFNDIQTAINAAGPGDTVLVADGLYTGPGNYDIRFNGKRVVLKSENGPHNCVIDCRKQGRAFYVNQNEPPGTTIEGLTVTGGQTYEGAGLYVSNNASLTIRNCIIQGNRADGYGGAICGVGYATVEVIGCLIRDNVGIYGGGAMNLDDATATITGCVIKHNVTDSYGAALRVYDTTLTVLNTDVSHNVSDNRAGVLYGYRTNATFTNCTFVSNSASYGGAFYVRYCPSVLITNCTFAANQAQQYAAGVFCDYDTTTVITNCIFTAHNNDAIREDYSADELVVSHCLFHANQIADLFRERDSQALFGEQINSVSPQNEGNLSGDPTFAFADDLHLMLGSRAIDRGTDVLPVATPATDIEGNPRILDGGNNREPRIDIGAYEFQRQQPTIAASPAEIEFTRELEGPNPNSRTLSIRNCGGNVLQWTIAEDCPWLRVDPNSGQASDKPTKLTVSVDADSMPPGVYHTTLSILDPAATNSPRQIPVTLRIKGILYVPDQYATIQQAVDAAMPGERIVVAEGVYPEVIRIEKPLELIGESGRNRPVIEPSYSGATAVYIGADGCVVKGFEIFHCRLGVYVDSVGNEVADNVIHDNQMGIEMSYQSGSTTLAHNLLLNNTERGVYVRTSRDHTLIQNTIAGSKVNFQVDGRTIQEFRHAIDTTNTVDGKPIYYLVDQANVVVDELTNAGCVFAISCSNIQIRDLDVANNATAVYLRETSNSIIERVTGTSLSGYGIHLVDSPNNTLIENIITDSGYGIFLSQSPNTTMIANRCNDNVANFGCVGNPEGYQQNINITNRTNGRPIYYVMDQIGGILDRSANPGCVFLINSSGVVLRDLDVEDNHVGITLVTCKGITVENTTTSGNAMAGVYVYQSGQSKLQNLLATDNQYGVYVDVSSATRIEHCTVTGNETGVLGSQGELQLVNCIVNNNGGGGGIRLQSTDAAIVHCNVCGNWRPEGYYYPGAGAGLFADFGSEASVYNTIFWGNSPDQIVGEPLQAGDPSRFSVSYCNVQGGFQGTGNIDDDPMLTPDGHLIAGSPCIDRGWYLTSSSNLDVDGEMRSVRLSVDIGIDEFYDVDGDGLPDWFESGYFSDKVAAHPGDDPDDDQHTNRIEYELYSSDPATAAVVYYVDPDRPDDSNDGLSWATAKRTIQAAVDLCENSDRILLAPGLFQQSLDLLGRQIRVQSIDPTEADIAASTVIAGTVVFARGEMPGCELAGVTVSNPNGTGVVCRGTSPTLRNCRIIRNDSSDYETGGGVHCAAARPLIIGCQIVGNISTQYGGGLYCLNSNPTLRSTLIAGNLTRWSNEAPALYARNSTLLLDNCTIADNGVVPDSSSWGSAILLQQQTQLVLTNSILWNDVPWQIRGDQFRITIAYTSIHNPQDAIQGPWQGRGNISCDPCFVESGYWTQNPFYYPARWVEGDYHLRSQGWRWSPTFSHGSHWVWDAQTSLCIDAGNPAGGLGNERSYVPNDPDNEWGENHRVNMGAYGSTVQASLPPSHWSLSGDLNDDGITDLIDLQLMAEGDVLEGVHCPADVNRDGRFDLADVTVVCESWLQKTAWYGSGNPLPPTPLLSDEPDGSDPPVPPGPSR